MTALTSLPFSKLKPGMRVYSANCNSNGVIVSKHKGSETLNVLHDNPAVAGATCTHVVSDISVIEADPLDQIHPMLAKNIKDFKNLTVEDLIADDNWVAEKKYDGERTILTYTPYPGMMNKVSFRATTRVVGKNTGRLGDNTQVVPHLAALPVSMDGVTVLDGELTHDKYGDDDEANFRLLRSIMGSLPEKALAAQKEHGSVSVRLYDILWYNGIDVRSEPLHVRRAKLEQWYADAADKYGSAGEGFDEEFGRMVSLSPQAETTFAKTILRDLSREQGWEGLMFKEINAPYTDSTKHDQRSKWLLKDKPFQDTEVIITGFEQGEGEYNKHKFGAIRFAQWVPRDVLEFSSEMAQQEVSTADAHIFVAVLKIGEMSMLHFLMDVGTASGFTDAQEAAFRADPEAFIGQVATVKFQSRWVGTGAMRHAHFKAMRPEVSTDACVYDPARAK